MTALLIYAVLWLLIGLIVLLGPVLYPGVGRLLIPSTNISSGWLAFLVSGFYMVRWYLARQQQLYVAAMNRKRQQIKKEAQKEITNPEFVFSDDGAPPPDIPKVDKGDESARPKKQIKHPEFAFDDGDETEFDDGDKGRQA